MKYLNVVSFLSILLFSSCGKTPFACFTISENEDSIPVNKEVQFNAICSDNAKEYFWDFPNDSISYDQFVTYTFKDTGIYKVVLLVTSGTKSKTFSKELTVKQP